MCQCAKLKKETLSNLKLNQLTSMQKRKDYESDVVLKLLKVQRYFILTSALFL